MDDRDAARGSDGEYRSDTEKASRRAKLSIALIGILALGSIGCMCAFIFALVAL